jgi:DNA-binding response OmpR family regulator
VILLFAYDLPGINGLELVRRARNLAHRSRTAVGVLSASSVEARGMGISELLSERRP